MTAKQIKNNATQNADTTILASIAKYAPLAITTIPASAIVISVAYYISYYSYFRLEFLWFLSIQDLISNAILWLPISFLYFSLIAFLDKIIEFFPKKVGRKNSNKFWGDLLLLLVPLLYLVYVIFFNPVYIPNAIILVAVFGVYKVAFMWIPPLNRHEEYNRWRALAIATFSVVIASVLIARDDAIKRSAFVKNIYLVEFIDASVQEIILVASVERGIIYLDRNKYISFVSHGQVKSIKTTYRGPGSFWRLSCVFSAYWCDPEMSFTPL